MSETLERKNSRFFFELVLFGLVAVFLFWRTRYGYYGSDENFLFGLAQRIYYGESLLVDEWHVCQHAGLFVYPFYWLYYMIFHTVEGMSMYFRYIYCVIYLITLIYLNKKLSHLAPYSYPMILCAALYTPLDHMTLSYTTLSFIFLMLISVKIYKDVLLDHGSARRNGIELGLLFTGITLCYPYFAAVFALIYIALFVLFFVRKAVPKEKKNRLDDELAYFVSLALWAALSIGICILAYCVFLFSRTNLKSILLNLPQILNDPQHPPRKFLFSIYDALYTSLMTGNETLASGLLYYGTAIILIVASFFSKRLRKYRVLILLLMLPLWIYSEVNIFLEPSYKLNRQMKDIFMVGILAFVLLEKRPWKLFCSFYISSIIYLLVTWLSSNTGLHVLSMGYAPGSICAVMILALFVREISQEYKNCGWRRAAALSGAVLFILGQSALELRVRLVGTYHDLPRSQLSEKIEDGPSKGIYTSSGRYYEYYDEYESISYLLDGLETEGKSFLALNSSPLVYLMADMPCASYSKWMLGDDNSQERVRTYYDINHHEAPDYIYDHNSTADISFITDAEYTFKEYGAAKLYIKK